MHGMVALDAADQVVRPAILWNDQRTAKECEEIDATLGAERVRQVTGNPPLTGFQAPKILWMRNNEPENFARTRSVMLPKDYVRFALDGAKATDVSDASGTGLFDIARRDWWDEGIEGLGLDRSWFPEAFESFGPRQEPPSPTPSSSAAQKSAQEEGARGVAGAGDQAAGAVGTGAVEPGIVSVSLGTSGVVFCSIVRPDPDPTGAVHTFCHANGAWHSMGVMLSCGGAVRWARDLLDTKGGYEEFNHLAGQAPPSCGGLTFLPYLSGERCPHNDPHARGHFAGLSLAHGRSHLSRAVLEGASFGIKDCLDRLAVPATEVRVTGGGAKSGLWMQVLADVLQCRCVRMERDEGPAFGAALLAGVGAGVWPDVRTACRETVRTADAFEPSGADYSEALARYRSLYPRVKTWTEP
jgi:xylulokinase